MKTPALALSMLSIFAAACLGCSRPAEPAQPEASASTGASAVRARQDADDATLTAKVKTALANEAGLKTLTIDVEANSGVVTLKGRVDTDDTKNRAQKAAEAVKGVTWVQNQLSVAPGAKPTPS